LNPTLTSVTASKGPLELLGDIRDREKMGMRPKLGISAHDTFGGLG
jgi:hypothetical protein